MKEAAKPDVDSGEALRQIRSHWLARAIHDFRGPMFAARGYARLLLDDKAGEVNSTQRRYLQNIADNIGAISALVDSLQEFPSESALDLEPVDVVDVLSSAVEHWRAQDEALQLTANIPAGPIVTAADRTKLTQAVRNLLAPTVEFSRCGGEVQVHARQDEDEFTVRVAAIRNGPVTSETRLDDLVIPREILRLHGGVAHADIPDQGRLYVSFRLPLVTFGLQKGK